MPQLTTNGRGTWIAAWRSKENISGIVGTDYDLFCSRSVDLGLTWSEPTLLNSNGVADSEDDYGPQLTTNGQGVWIAVWGSFSNDLEDLRWVLFLARSEDQGRTWSEPAYLRTKGSHDRT